MSPASGGPRGSASLEGAEREILVPHEAEIRPLTAVKNVVVQASLNQLRAHGHYERYSKLVDPSVLSQLIESLGPGWVPLSLVEAHYRACDDLRLTDEELLTLGRGVGYRVHTTALIVSGRARDYFDTTSPSGPLHRMWGRLYQGGSVQVVNIGTQDRQLELRGFGALNRLHYYRLAQLAVVTSAYEAMGAKLAAARLISWNAQRDELILRFTFA
jgi:hypothetical protein